MNILGVVIAQLGNGSIGEPFINYSLQHSLGHSIKFYKSFLLSVIVVSSAKRKWFRTSPLIDFPSAKSDNACLNISLT